MINKIQWARFKNQDTRYKMQKMLSPESCPLSLESCIFHLEPCIFHLESCIFHLDSCTLPVPAFQNTHLVNAAISTRIGGVSQNHYQSLNLAYHVGDAHTSVSENRRRFFEILGMDVGSLVIAQQIHGDEVVVVDESHSGFGAYTHENAIIGADAMITNTRFLALGILTADCVPIMVLDPVKKAIGIAHAGWRGMLKMIGAKTIHQMEDAFGTRPADCLVNLGPSIGPCCYTVGEDIIRQFHESFGAENCITYGRLDLQLAARKQLIDSGLKADNIWQQKLCTACNLSLFYSFRAEGGVTGRMMSVISLVYD
jgi:YfiH family protein